ncbi:unnamed protein product [Sphagnum tenellum]
MLVEAGEYYLGDPCYAFSHQTWDMLLEQSNHFANHIGQIGGLTVIAFRTAHGDGNYRNLSLGDVMVDSGMIGLVPVDAADREPNPSHMYRVSFPRAFYCTNNNGTLVFGEYRIDTNPEEDFDYPDDFG